MVKSREFVPAEAGMKSRLFSGLTAQMVTFVIFFIESIVLIPFFIDAWGSSTYQGWVVLSSAAYFLVLSDLGTSYYFDNSIRMTWTAGKEEDYQRNVAVGFGCYLLLFAFICALVVIFALRVDFDGVFGDIHINSTSARYIFILLAITVLIDLVRIPIASIYNARGDFTRRELFFSLQSIIRLCTIVFLLIASFSPTVVAFASLVVAFLIGLVWLVIDQKGRYPDSRYSVALPNKKELRSLLRISALYVIPRSLDPVVTYIPVILLSTIGPGGLSVVTFTVARTFAGLIRTFAFAFSWVVGIELSRQLSQNAQEAQARLFENSYRFISTSVGFLSGFAIVVAEPAIHFWTRGEVPYDAWVLYALVLRMIVCSPLQVASAYFRFTNKPAPLAAANSLHIVIALSLCVMLNPSLGALGTAIALFVSETVGNACLMYILAARHLEVRPLRLVVKHHSLGVLSFGLSAACALMAYRIFGQSSLLNLALGGIVWALIVSVPALFLVFRPSQRGWIWVRAKTFAGRFALRG